MRTFRPGDWDSCEGGRQYTAHVVPTGDLIVHDINTDGDCVCGPATIPVEAAHGGFGWVYQHHSLDGRELGEGNT
jgi:hypothetical protein